MVDIKGHLIEVKRRKNKEQRKEARRGDATCLVDGRLLMQATTRKRQMDASLIQKNYDCIF